ncbi:Small-conductance mechanosensitive channel [Polystyrenella longa]|uniref:Small-conductance mechanosensitive channel n=1 Tax=Polystyrenella longa TaxID=2528007 RepID=A0A518CHL2_9PLAN|nr:mechanosensitive ion channel family protein [Polystyrenella longa]QDU78710.1 Small-conductance mechanosensitive channel [Polystyrenella longa]
MHLQINQSRFYGIVHLLLFLSLFAGISSSAVFANFQESADDDAVIVTEEEKEIDTPDKVEVNPVAIDEDISGRLQRIYNASGWFESVEVETDEGIVILKGIADSDPHREWAERVAQRTSDVVAVVNQLKVQGRPIWDIQPAIVQLKQLGRDFVHLLPLLIVGVMVIILAYVIAKLTARLSRRLTARRIDSQLIQQVVGSIVGVLIMLIGIYIALKVSGLSRLAVTVLGGTGLIGLAIGFAFRDIAENYLASVLISLNRPFNVGDLIELEGHEGFVRRVTTRGTLLLTVEGNHVQIPNSTVYKSIVINYSSSPRIRKEFVIGIGYDDSVTKAQQAILRVLTGHETVLEDPAPLVLVESLGASTVNLNVSFWLDGERFDAPSVCSALMRQTKTALTEAKISMPDEAREVVFPNGVPVVMVKESHSKESAAELSQEEATKTGKPDAASLCIDEADKAASTDAEGDLRNTNETIQRHAKEVENDTEENLIS